MSSVWVPYEGFVLLPWLSGAPDVPYLVTASPQSSMLFSPCVWLYPHSPLHKDPSHKGLGLPYSSDGKESDCKAGDPGSIPGLGRFPGEGNHNPLQYACLEKPMDRGAWQAAVYGITKNWT